MKLYSSLMLLVLQLLAVSVCILAANNVTYDRRSLIIDGRRKLLLSGSIHYPRSVPAMWPRLIQTAKEGGLDAIETYVFWNGHEISPGNYNFEGRYDIVKFIKLIQQAGMYSILRIGPFIAAEWNYGGIPVWLHYIPGTVFRTDNEPFKFYMQNFTTFIVNLLKREKLFASQGGPIIMAQIENEYGTYESFYGEDGKKYTMWAANMAVSQNTGVPWNMCLQPDAPRTVINTCNFFYCDQFTPIYPDKPKVWTENWTGWFKTFGDRIPQRPPEDTAFAVARFFQKGGSLQNYYMYHGGMNFGRTAGGPFITTSYDYDAPIDEFGLPRLPNWGHLSELHKAIKLCEPVMLKSKPVNMSLGPSLEAHIYTVSSGPCAAFIANLDSKNDTIVEFRNATYQLPAWSVSILPDCKNVVFNTAQVASQTEVVKMVPEKLRLSAGSPGEGEKAWHVFKEEAGIWSKADFVKSGFDDHINTTKDTTDYLWYTTSIFVDGDEKFLKKKRHPVLTIESKGHGFHVFVNQELQGSAFGNASSSPCSFKRPISLKAGKNDIAILSMTVGLQTVGPFYEWIGAGLTNVTIKGLNEGIKDFSSYNWSYKIGLQGEHLGIHKADGVNGVNWVSTSTPPKRQPLTWYKLVLDPPTGDEPVALDMIHMGKGLAWLNGEEIGRYWPRKSSKEANCWNCDYRGKAQQPNVCFGGCGEPTQRWYHVPRSWFKPSGNVLVIFEEVGGDPTKIRLSKRKTTGVCAFVAENFPSARLHSFNEHINSNYTENPAAHLKCPPFSRISSIKFASFGNPSGKCGSFLTGDCHDPNSLSTVQKVCLNKVRCSVELTEDNFNTSLCPGVTKKLAVEAVCS